MCTRATYSNYSFSLSPSLQSSHMPNSKSSPSLQSSHMPNSKSILFSTSLCIIYSCIVKLTRLLMRLPTAVVSNNLYTTLTFHFHSYFIFALFVFLSFLTLSFFKCSVFSSFSKPLLLKHHNSIFTKLCTPLFQNLKSLINHFLNLSFIILNTGTICCTRSRIIG